MVCRQETLGVNELLYIQTLTFKYLGERSAVVSCDWDLNEKSDLSLSCHWEMPVGFLYCALSYNIGDTKPLIIYKMTLKAV